MIKWDISPDMRTVRDVSGRWGVTKLAADRWDLWDRESPSMSIIFPSCKEAMDHAGMAVLNQRTCKSTI